MFRPSERYFEITQSAGAVPEKDVLVVGAGISGLSAAFYLKQAGLKVDLFEGETIQEALCKAIEARQAFYLSWGRIPFKSAILAF